MTSDITRMLQQIIDEMQPAASPPVVKATTSLSPLDLFLECEPQMIADLMREYRLTREQAERLIEDGVLASVAFDDWFVGTESRYEKYM